MSHYRKALEGPRDVFGAARFNSDLVLDRSGDWTVIYEARTISLLPRGLMPVSELEAHFGAIGR